MAAGHRHRQGGEAGSLQLPRGPRPVPGQVDASHVIAVVALSLLGAGGRASQGTSSEHVAGVGAAQLEGGAAQAALAPTLGPVLWKAGGGALTA